MVSQKTKKTFEDLKKLSDCFDSDFIIYLYIFATNDQATCSMTAPGNLQSGRSRSVDCTRTTGTLSAAPHWLQPSPWTATFSLRRDERGEMRDSYLADVLLWRLDEGFQQEQNKNQNYWKEKLENQSERFSKVTIMIY